MGPAGAQSQSRNRAWRQALLGKMALPRTGDRPRGEGGQESFTLQPVEGALGLGGPEALAPGDDRVIPQEAADCSSVELAICPEKSPMGTAPSHASLSPLRTPSDPSTVRPACRTQRQKQELGKVKPEGTRGHWAPWE